MSKANSPFYAPLLWPILLIVSRVCNVAARGGGGAEKR